MRLNSPSGNSQFFSSDGVYNVLFDSENSATISAQAFSANSEFKIEIMSIQQANNYGEYIGVTQNDVSIVCFDENGNIVQNPDQMMGDFDPNDFNSQDWST